MKHTIIALLSRCAALLVALCAGMTFAQTPPDNDFFVNATSIASLPFSASENVLFATSEGSDPNSCFGSSNDVWFSFTAPRDMVLVADTIGSTYDTALSVHQGSPGNFSQVSCNNDANGTQQSEVTFHALAGQTYHFLVALLSSEVEPILTFNLSEGAAVANDFPGGATAVTTLPFMATQQTGGATTSPDDPVCSGNSNNVWFKFKAPRDMRLEANTFGSDFDTTLSAFASSPVQSALVACNDNDPTSEQSKVSFNAKAGTTYYFLAAGQSFFSPSGNLVFTLLDAGAPIPPFLFAVGIDRVGTTEAGVGATLHGTAVCNKTATLAMDIFLSQKVGKVQRQGQNFVLIDCIRRRRSKWSVEVAPFEKNFIPFAPAKVESSISACDPEDPEACQSKTLNRNVLLLPAFRH